MSWSEACNKNKFLPLEYLYLFFFNILIGRDLWRTLKLFQLQNLQYQIPQSNSKNRTKYLMIHTKSFSILSGSVTKWVISYCEIPETNHFANQLLPLSDCNTCTFRRKAHSSRTLRPSQAFRVLKKHEGKDDSL